MLFSYVFEQWPLMLVPPPNHLTHGPKPSDSRYAPEYLHHGIGVET